MDNLSFLTLNVNETTPNVVVLPATPFMGIASFREMLQRFGNLLWEMVDMLAPESTINTNSVSFVSWQLTYKGDCKTSSSDMYNNSPYARSTCFLFGSPLLMEGLGGLYRPN